MDKRFVLVDRGLTSSIFKFPRNQKARLESELANEDHEYFDSLAEAKAAGTVIVSRYEKGTKKATGMFAAKPDPALEHLKSQLTYITEDAVEDYFL